MYQISDNLVHQGLLRYGVSDRTFEAKKDQPKLFFRTLVLIPISDEVIQRRGSSFCRIST